MKNLTNKKSGSKISSVLLVVAMIFGVFTLSACQFLADHADLDKNHACDCGCEQSFGDHADTNKDHACDYGCSDIIGACEDVDQNHACDYGCDKLIGECVDADKDHECDYGCSKTYGEHADTNKDHACDYGCSKNIGTCEDADNDHDCDYGCAKTYGEHIDADNDHDCDYGCEAAIGTHEDANKDHACDYGCLEKIGVHEDTDNDHACDYGCLEKIGVHEDTDNDHACDYGCQEAIGICADGNKDHQCDDGCSKTYGEHVDANNDHACDYGCTESIGECVDSDNDHDCDYGCSKTYGEHADTNNDHACEYGCSEKIGTCEDADQDHDCDYGCSKTYGEHVDTNNDHACDYGCTESIGECVDSDNDHNCDYGCSKTYGEHVDANNDHACEYGCNVSIGVHAVAEKSHNCAYCNATMTACSDEDNDYMCDVCGNDLCTEHVEATKEENRTEATCKADGSYELVTYCSACGAEISRETKTLPKNDNHVPAEAIKENEVAADCNSNSKYEEVVNCSVCGEELSRETKENENSATGIHCDNDGDLDCDSCEAKYYVITLEDAVAKAESNSTSIVENAFVEGDKVTVTADEFKTVDGTTYMFVGFDKNTVDNRVGKEGIPSYTFNMPAEAFTITAKYAVANTTFFSTGKFYPNAGWADTTGWTGSVITNSADPDLLGLSGYSFFIPDNKAASTNAYSNYESVTRIATWGPDQEHTVKFILKNHGAYDVTVAIVGEHYGAKVSSGNITIPAGETVVAIVHFDINMFIHNDIGATSMAFQVQVQKDIGGDGSGTIQLDIVAAAAKTYTSKVSSMIATSDKDVFMDFGEISEGIESNKYCNKWGGNDLRTWDEYGVISFTGTNKADNYASERANAIGGTEIDLNKTSKMTLYVKATNLMKNPGEYQLIFTFGNTTLSGAIIGTQDLKFSGAGDTLVYEVVIEFNPEELYSSGVGNLQVGLKVASGNSSDKCNVIVQIASENVFGELSE